MYLDNNIGDLGAQALAESLKENKTLTQLNLESMSEPLFIVILINFTGNLCI